MRRSWLLYTVGFLIGVSLTPLLSGCTTTAGSLRDIEQAADEDSTLSKKLADRLLGEVGGQDHRAVRMCMIAAVASELVAYRMSKEPEQAMMGYGQIVALEGAVNRFERADAMWLNTEIAQVTLTMTSIMVDSAKARIPRLLSNFAGGINVLGLLDRAAIAAGQGTLMAAGIQDIRERVTALNTGTADPALSMAACRARIDLNQDRVAAMIGMTGPQQP
ncbi:hypothetical protein [Dongia sp.]|uniref:hypothetical protein n=1 Tax=Dongia sp. TaxID=1977262 RepID=UPI0035AEE6A7